MQRLNDTLARNSLCDRTVLAMDVMSLFADVGRWALIDAVLAAALIGILYITRGTAVRHVRGFGGS